MKKQTSYKRTECQSILAPLLTAIALQAAFRMRNKKILERLRPLCGELIAGSADANELRSETEAQNNRRTTHGATTTAATMHLLIDKGLLSWCKGCRSLKLGVFQDLFCTLVCGAHDEYTLACGARTRQ